jgi:hypothetical protein
MTPVDSSHIRRIGRAGSFLYVEFKNGSLYRYSPVSTHIYHELKNAPSIGSFLNDQIKNMKYRCERVDLQEPDANAIDRFLSGQFQVISDGEGLGF